MTAEGHPPRPSRLDAIWLTAIVGTALLLRFLYVWQSRASPYFAFEIMDPAIHDAWAKAIAGGQPFSEGVYFRAPLYPWFLGSLYWLTDVDYLAVRLIQSVLGSLSCGLVYLIGRSVFSRTVAGLAGLASAGYWILIFYDAELLIPVLAVFLNLLAIWGLFRVADRPGVGRILLAGLPLGLSALARPNILLFAPPAFFWLLWTLPRWKPALRGAAIYTFAVVLPIAPITLRNAIVGGDLVLIASQGGVNFHIGNNPQSDGMHVYIPGLTTKTDDIYYGSTDLAQREAGRPLKASEVSGHYSAKAVEFITGNPTAAARLMLAKCGYFWTHREILNNKHIYVLVDRYAPILRWLPLGFWIVGPLGMLGLAASFLRARRLFPLWGFVLAYMASIVIFFVNARFRVPVLPVLILLGVHGVDVAWRAIAARQWRRVAWLAAALALGIALALPAPTEVSASVALEKLGATLFLQGRTDEAVEMLREGIDVDPQSPQIRYTLARLYDESGQPDRALPVYEGVVRVDPDFLPALKRLGELYVAEGRSAGAIETLKKVAAREPHSARVHFELAEACLAESRADEALAALAAGMRAGPPPVGTLDVATASLIRMKRFGDAVPLLDEWRRLDAGSVEPLTRLAYLRATAPDPSVRDCAAALEASETATRMTRRRSAVALDALAAAHAECGQFDRAVDVVGQSIELSRRNGNRRQLARSTQAERLYRQGRPLRLK